MNLGIVLRGYVLLILVGALFKMNHWQGASWLLILGLVLGLAVTLAVLVEIVKSRYLSGGEKVLWMTAVLLSNIIGILLYLLMGRQRAPTGFRR